MLLCQTVSDFPEEWFVVCTWYVLAVRIVERLIQSYIYYNKWALGLHTGLFLGQCWAETKSIWDKNWIVTLSISVAGNEGTRFLDLDDVHVEEQNTLLLQVRGFKNFKLTLYLPEASWWKQFVRTPFCVRMEIVFVLHLNWNINECNYMFHLCWWMLSSYIYGYIYR